MKPMSNWAAAKVAIYIVFIEALLVWGFFTFRGLADAVRDAAIRLEQNGNYAERK